MLIYSSVKGAPIDGLDSYEYGLERKTDDLFSTGPNTKNFDTFVHQYMPACLLRLLSVTPLICRFAVKPDAHKGQPCRHCNPNTCNPCPPSSDPPAARILVMSEMPDGYFSLNVDICKKRSLVVDTKGENAMLIRRLERSTVKSTVDSSRDGFEVEAMKR